VQPREGGRVALVFRLPVDDQVWWLSQEGPGPVRPVTTTLLVWLAALALATLGALLLSVRMIARPLAALADDIGRQQGALQPLPLPPAASAEVQALVQAFNHLAAQTAAQAQSRQQLLAGVSHDLRTPLARLRLRVETQCEGAVADALTADLHALERIVDQFLAYVQGDTGVPQGHPLALADAAEEAVRRYAETGQPVRLVLEGGEALERPVPDLAVQRLLANLIDNALAYGRSPVEVHVQAGPDGAELRVTDSGAGMSEAEFVRAQRPFVRLGQARGQLGHCGLGLAIVAQVAGLLGARLQAQRGADGRFSVSLHLPPPAQG
jgi:two-component system osmolarity sensor histidine kinase EnvZ